MLFIVSGPSGSGKTTFTKRLVEEIDQLIFSISYTTRNKRPREIDGVDYRFVSLDKFKEMIERNEFAEWAVVHGSHYGTPLGDLKNSENTDRDFVLDINIEGAMNIKSRFVNGVFIFLLPPSLDILKQRLLNRNDLNPDEVESRMDGIKNEIEVCNEYDYIIINNELENSYNKLKSIVISERCKPRRLLRKFSLSNYLYD